jgi:hypothetical protein
MIRNNQIVVRNGVITKGNDIWESFKEMTQAGESNKVNFIVIDDDGKYSNSIEYDGENYIYKDEKQGRTYKKKYLLDLFINNNDHSSRWVLLSNEKLTAEELEKSIISSDSSDTLQYDLIFGYAS